MGPADPPESQLAYLAACVLQQRRGLSTGLASSVSSSKTATLTRSWKATQTRTLRKAMHTCYLATCVLQQRHGIATGIRTREPVCAPSCLCEPRSAPCITEACAPVPSAGRLAAAQCWAK